VIAHNPQVLSHEKVVEHIEDAGDETMKYLWPAKWWSRDQQDESDG